MPKKIELSIGWTANFDAGTLNQAVIDDFFDGTINQTPTIIDFLGFSEFLETADTLGEDFKELFGGGKTRTLADLETAARNTNSEWYQNAVPKLLGDSEPTLEDLTNLKQCALMTLVTHDANMGGGETIEDDEGIVVPNPDYVQFRRYYNAGSTWSPLVSDESAHERIYPCSIDLPALEFMNDATIDTNQIGSFYDQKSGLGNKMLRGLYWVYETTTDGAAGSKIKKGQLREVALKQSQGQAKKASIKKLRQAKSSFSINRSRRIRRRY